MSSSRAAGCALLLACTVVVEEVRAEEGFALNRFEPAERGSAWFVLDSLDLKGTHRPAAGLTIDYQHRPLAIYGPDGKVRSAIVEHMLTTHAGASFVALDRLRIGLNLPVVLYSAGERGSLQGVTYPPPASSTTVGDVRLGLDGRLFGATGSPITAALGGRLWLPTGSASSYTGDAAVRGGPRLAAAGKVAMFVYGANVGVAFRSARTFAGTPLDHDLVYGVSAGASLAGDKVLVGPELYGSTSLGDQAFKTRGSPVEILLGAHMALPAGFRAGLGIGTGLVGGFGAPGVRGLASIEWVLAAPGRDGTAPVVEGGRDTDGDGVPDAEDACMDVFGKRTRDKRTNGCDDRDRDGIMDPLDACPFEGGPASADPSTNGCPPRGAVAPPDRDKDGVPDDVDACPEVFGNRSATPALNGCPDPDPDKDGIPTEVDACPDVAGNADPDPNKNGCPVAFLQGTQIKLKEQPRFRAAEILPASEGVLQSVVDLLKQHPEVTKVRVEGHTDGRGIPAANKKLSEQRAAAVLNWLVAHGIERARVVSVGLGGDRPIAENTTDAGRDENLRIELHVEYQTD